MSTAALIAADFKTRPYNHQMRDFELYAEAPARAYAWHMRTGKTKAIIDRACHLYRAGLIDAVLVFAPKGVHANWIERELPIHAWESVPVAGLIWQTSIAGDKAVDPKERAEWWRRLHADAAVLFWLAMNSESMTRPDSRKAIAYLLRKRRVFVVFDESDDFGIPGSKRTKMARALARKCPYRAILSGTMLTASPLAAFSQFELLEPGALGFKRFSDFKARYAIQEQRRVGSRTFSKIVGYQNEDDLRDRMARFTSVVMRSDCSDMPALVFEVRNIEPSKEQMEAYRALRKSFLVEIEGELISVGEFAQRLGKMQQVFSGFIIDEHGTRRTIPGPNPRLDAVAEEVSRAPGKVIIWCNYQADIDLVKQRLLADGFKIVEYHGRVSDKAKSQALASFKADRDVKALVGHAQSGGRGIDMSVASTIIWYSHTFKARLRQQALERATKIGGGNIRVIDFKSPGPDAYILETVSNRIDVADAIAGIGMRKLLQELEL